MKKVKFQFQGNNTSARGVVPSEIVGPLVEEPNAKGKRRGKSRLVAPADTAPRTLAIPTQGAVQQSLEPGKYLLKSRLPSGKTLVRAFNVNQSDKPQNIHLEAPFDTDLDLLGFSSAPEPSRSSKKRKSPSQGWWLRLWSYDGDREDAWRHEALDGKNMDRREHAEVTELIMSIWNPDLAGIRVLEVGKEGHLSRFMVVPPVPELRLTITRSPTAPLPRGGIETRFTSTSPDHLALDATLSYMAENSSRDANTLATEVVARKQQRPDGSPQDPFAALVMCLYAMKNRQDAGDLDTSLFEQVYRDGAPNYADSCILLAWHLMGTEPDIERIKRLLLEGVRKGVPLFVSSLRVLFERLRGLKDYLRSKDADDPSVALISASVETVGGFLGATDQTQVLTQYYGTHPWNPTTNTALCSEPLPIQSVKVAKSPAG